MQYFILQRERQVTMNEDFFNIRDQLNIECNLTNH